MIFGEKAIVTRENNFTYNDLYEYLVRMLKTALQRDRKMTSGYSYVWLTSKELTNFSVEHYLADLRPLILKMPPECCVSIAVKLDKLPERSDYTISDLLDLMKQLLLEQDNISLIQKSVKGARQRGNRRRPNKVHPELNGRLPTVSFIIETELDL